MALFGTLQKIPWRITESFPWATFVDSWSGSRLAKQQECEDQGYSLMKWFVTVLDDLDRAMQRARRKGFVKVFNRAREG